MSLQVRAAGAVLIPVVLVCSVGASEPPQACLPRAFVDVDRLCNVAELVV